MTDVTQTVQCLWRHSYNQFYVFDVTCADGTTSVTLLVQSIQVWRNLYSQYNICDVTCTVDTTFVVTLQSVYRRWAFSNSQYHVWRHSYSQNNVFVFTPTVSTTFLTSVIQSLQRFLTSLVLSVHRFDSTRTVVQRPLRYSCRQYNVFYVTRTVITTCLTLLQQALQRLSPHVKSVHCFDLTRTVNKTSLTFLVESVQRICNLNGQYYVGDATVLR